MLFSKNQNKQEQELATQYRTSDRCPNPESTLQLPYHREVLTFAVVRCPYSWRRARLPGGVPYWVASVAGKSVGSQNPGPTTARVREGRPTEGKGAVLRQRLNLRAGIKVNRSALRKTTIIRPPCHIMLNINTEMCRKAA